MKHLLHKTLALKALMLVTLLMGAVSSAWADETTGTISFSSSGTDVKISSASVTGDDSAGNEWTITTEGTTSFTSNTAYYQIGSAKKPATSITFTTTLSESVNITAMSAKFGGFSGTAGTVTLKVGDTTVGTGSLDAANDVVVSSSSAAEGTVLTVTITDIAKGMKAYYISYTYEAVGGPSDPSVATTTTISDSGITNTDVYVGTAAGSLTATVTDGENAIDGATVTWSGDNDEVATIDAKTGAVTLVAVGTVTFTATYAGVENEYKGSSDTYELTVTDSTPIPTHTATFSVNGETSEEEFEEGADIEFPEDPEEIDGKTFMGWVAEAITGVTDDAPEFVTSAKMGDGDVTYYAVFATAGQGVGTVDDVLNRDFTGVTGTSYSDWSGKTGTSGAVYAGNSAGGNSSIQLRTSNSKEGVVTTTSGGKVTRIAVKWNSNTASGRTIDVYASNSAYSAASKLYSSTSSDYGTKIGSLSKSDGDGYLDITGNYTYIGFRSTSGALYLDAVTITWSTASATTYSGYCTTVATDTREEAGISFEEDAVTEELVSGYTGQALTNPNELAVTYNSTDESVATVDENGVLTVLAVGETTITATFAGNEDYKAGNASYTLTIQDSRVAIEPAFAAESIRVILNRTAAAPALYGNEGNGTVTYASSDETIATVNPSTGEVTGVADGEATITATIAASQTHQGGEATFTVTVIDQYKKGSANLPYTVEEAIAAIDAGVGVTGVYARGVVSEIVTAFNSTYGNISYNITDESGEVLQSYRGFSYNGDKFGSADDIQEGDAVVIYGNLTKYNTTYEFAQNNQLVARVASSTESVSATIPTSGYATLSSVAPLNFSATDSNDSDYKAWYITSVEGSTVTLEQITGTIAGCQGVILHGNAGTYDIPTATAADATELEGNLLVATNIATEIGDNEAYGLKNGQFQMINAGTMPAGKAYLPVSAVPSSSEVKSLTLVFNDATGIQRTEVIPATDVVYSLQGIRIQNPTKGGVYIVNGKKVVIK